MIVAIPEFSRMAEACQKKFEMVFKPYKEDKLANSVLGNDRHECKFYDSIDYWWHQVGSVMKQVSATTMDNISVGGQENLANVNDNVLQPVNLSIRTIICLKKEQVLGPNFALLW